MHPINAKDQQEIIIAQILRCADKVTTPHFLTATQQAFVNLITKI